MNNPDPDPILTILSFLTALILLFIAFVMLSRTLPHSSKLFEFAKILEPYLERIGVFLVGAFCVTLGYRLLVVDISGGRLVTAFLSVLGVQMILWAIGIRLYLLGNIPDSSDN